MLVAGAAAAQRTDIVVGMQLEPPILDPTAGAAAAIDEVVYANVFEGLTRFAPDGAILPALAESWEIAPDGLSWVFHLREGVTFHDGTPFTAEDVVFSFDRAMAEGSLNAQKELFDGINEVTAIDDVTRRDRPRRAEGLAALQPRLGRRGDRLAGDRRRQRDRSRSAPARSRSRDWVQGDRVELVAQRRLLGRGAGAREGDLQVHLRPDRGLRRDDGRRHRRLPELPGAGEPARSSRPTRASR